VNARLFNGPAVKHRRTEVIEDSQNVARRWRRNG
jgi:hypothetical protein